VYDLRRRVAFADRNAQRSCAAFWSFLDFTLQTTPRTDDIENHAQAIQPDPVGPHLWLLVEPLALTTRSEEDLAIVLLGPEHGLLLCLSERIVKYQSSAVELFIASAPAERQKTITIGRFAATWSRTINTNSRTAEIWTHGIWHGTWRDHRRKHGSST
jgi:hypothetical protein